MVNGCKDQGVACVCFGEARRAKKLPRAVIGYSVVVFHRPSVSWRL